MTPIFKVMGKMSSFSGYKHRALGYMQAPTILHYYLISKYNHTISKPTVLNMAKYIREQYNKEKLATHIIEGKGVLSRNFLLSILGKRQIREVGFEQINDDMLKRYGPMLLSEFAVCDDFGIDGRLVYSLDGCNASAATLDGGPTYIGCDYVATEDRLIYAKGFETTDRCTGYHAMIIVGVRYEGASVRFLVQNWWRRHQFVEISREYLETQPLRGPCAFFVDSAPRALPARFALPARRYAESTHLDTQETEPRNC